MITITCVECNHSFQISEEKIPSATFKVKCPACKNVFQARVPLQPPVPEVSNKPEPTEPVWSHVFWEKVKPEVEAVVKTQLDLVRSDILLSLASLIGRQNQNVPVNSDSYVELRALLCIPDPEAAQQLNSMLQKLKYATQICTTCSEALTRIETGFFNVITTDLVFPDDPEGGSKILAKINARKPDERRKMFVAVVCGQVKTTGPQAAFFHGANILVQKSDIGNFENYLQEGLRYYGELYSNYHQLLKQIAEV